MKDISIGDGWVDIKKRRDSADLHPEALFAFSDVNTTALADALLRIGEYVADHGLEGQGPYQAARDLVSRHVPRVGGQPLRADGETSLGAALRLALALDGGVLPIQGPPGSGKTFAGARMILAIANAGLRVGVTANSHKVIRNLLDEVCRAADEIGVDLTCIQKVMEEAADEPRLRFRTDNAACLSALHDDCRVAGGTAWLWARPDAVHAVDVLFVDEAAQMSLANVLAVSQAARTVVLLGDPQQLDQPTQGSHPDGVDTSALDHILAGRKTMPEDRGLFLEETWRLHPTICAFVVPNRECDAATCRHRGARSTSFSTCRRVCRCSTYRNANLHTEVAQVSRLTAAEYSRLLTADDRLMLKLAEAPCTTDNEFFIKAAHILECRNGRRRGTEDRS